MATIQERFDYIKICDIAIETYSSQFQDSNRQIGTTPNLLSEDKRQELGNIKAKITYYKDLKYKLVNDLTHDPNFMSYTNSLNATQQNNQDLNFRL